MNIVEQLRARWRVDWQTGRLNPLTGAFGTALRIAEALPKVREEAGRSGELSRKGIAARVREAAARDVRALKGAREEADRVRALLLRERAGLGLPAIDRKDAAGAIERMEARAFLRGLAHGERVKLAMEDRLFAEAALSAPAALSGFDAATLDALRARLAETASPAAVAAIEEMEEALTVADAALALAESVIAEEADARSDPGAFKAWRETAEAA